MRLSRYVCVKKSSDIHNTVGRYGVDGENTSRRRHDYAIIIAIIIIITIIITI